MTRVIVYCAVDRSQPESRIRSQEELYSHFNSFIKFDDEKGVDVALVTDIEGTYSVHAAAREATGSAGVIISAGSRSLKQIVVSPQDAHISPHWSGEIPHQKWTQFYNMEEVEEMRSALRELGLEDDVAVD